MTTQILVLWSLYSLKLPVFKTLLLNPYFCLGIPTQKYQFIGYTAYMHLARYVEEALAHGALTVDSHVGFTGLSAFRPCLESPVTQHILLSGAWPRHQIPRDFSSKKPEDMRWKARPIVVLVRAAAAIEPSIQPSPCPRPVVFTPSICSCKSVVGQRGPQRTDIAALGSGIYISD